MSSAQVIRDCQHAFNPSKMFAPMIAEEKALRAAEPQFQRKRRSKAKQEIRVKMGHGGTLDPLATGVLILGVGKGTKSLQNYILCTKTYETIVLFGASTDTYDRAGRIIKKGPYDGLTRQATEKALESFRGKIRQMPPLYSALKMQGKPLYEYAREGKPIPREIETREVEVKELELVEWYPPGTHNHRWPAEEADQAEKDLAGSVWHAAEQQQQQAQQEKAGSDGSASSKPAAAAAAAAAGEEGEGEGKGDREAQALAEYNTRKREAEERVDSLVSDEQQQQQPAKKRKTGEDGSAEPMMSGALKPLVPPAGRGSNLVPPPPSPSTPPPWKDKGPPAAKIRMTVTSGFYVRSLCHDLGEKLGCGAMMAELSRTRQGEFALGGANCMEYDDILKGEDVWAPKVRSMLEQWNKRDARGPEPNSNCDGPPAQPDPASAADKEADAGEEAQAAVAASA